MEIGTIIVYATFGFIALLMAMIFIQELVMNKDVRKIR